MLQSKRHPVVLLSLRATGSQESTTGDGRPAALEPPSDSNHALSLQRPGSKSSHYIAAPVLQARQSCHRLQTLSAQPMSLRPARQNRLKAACFCHHLLTVSGESSRMTLAFSPTPSRLRPRRTPLRTNPTQYPEATSASRPRSL